MTEKAKYMMASGAKICVWERIMSRERLERAIAGMHESQGDSDAPRSID